MPTRALPSVAGCLAVLALLASSCAPAAAPPAAPAATPAPKQVDNRAAKPAEAPTAPAPTPKATGEQPRYGGILTKASPSDPTMLDFYLNTGAAILENVGSVYNGLFQYDPKQNDKVINDLVEKWEASADGKVYTFELKKGVKFHDGNPMTAEDAAFNLMRARFDKLSQLREYTELIEKAEAITADTLKVTLSQPWCAFLANLGLTYLSVFPKHVVEARGSMRTVAIGTGPFKLKEYVQGVGTELVKNPDYFVKGRPYLDGIKVLIVKDEAARFAAFRTGQVRLTPIGPSALSPSQAKLVQSQMQDKAKVLVLRSLVSSAFTMQTSRQPWDDVRLRQAVNLAVDRQAGVKVLEAGDGDIGTVPGIAPKSEWIIPEDELLKMPGFRQPKDADREQAKKLLAEAGFPNGFKTKALTRAGYSTYENVAVFMKDQLATIGINVELDSQESVVYMDRRGRLAYESMAGLVAPSMVDPDGVGRVLGRENVYGFRDDKISELFDKQRATTDAAERRKLILELQKRALELSPYVVASVGYTRVGIWNDVRDYGVPVGNYNNHKYQNTWLAK